MMNREEELVNFFENLKSIIKFNPNSLFDMDDVYNLLTIYDVDYKHESSIRNQFDSWINHFSNNPNINVYVSPNQNKFLQFRNGHYGDNCEYVKLYVHLDSHAISAGVEKIFDFLADNNIVHCSKVSERVRSDMIVLRIKKPEDVYRVIDYINSDDFLVKNSRKVNPFLVRKGIVGLAYDDKMSYNSSISFLISEYLSSINYRQNIDSISFDGFKKFVHKYIIEIFSNKASLNKFMSSSYFQEENYRIRNSFFSGNSLIHVLINFKNVFDLIESNLECVDDFDMFMNSYKKSIDAETKSLMNFNFVKLLNDEEKEETEDITKYKKLFDEFIMYAYTKYDNKIEHVIFSIEGFMLGNNDYITRDNDFRSKFASNLNKDIILKITNGDYRGYINDRLNAAYSKNSYDLFLEACMATYKKYGFKQLAGAIEHGLMGEYVYFTNDNELRDKLTRDVSVQDFYNNVFSLVENVGLDSYEKIARAAAYAIILNNNTKDKNNFTK